jgi:xylulokinase
VTRTEATIVVTLDIGGSAAKASAYDIARNACIGSTAQPYPSAPSGGDPGTFDPEEWWLAAIGALHALAQILDMPAGSYLGITVSAIRIPFVMLDGRGDAVGPCLLNKDRRALAYVPRIAAALGPDEVYRTTGHWPAPEWGLPKICWVRDTHRHAWRRMRSLLQLHDWFVYKLSGIVASEPSSAAMSQMLDINARTWATGLLAALDLPAAMLPELRHAGERAGGLLPPVARATGFAAGTPVHIGGGDTHMSALSVGVDEGAPVVVAGTTAPAQLAVPDTSLPAQSGDVFPLLVSEHVVPQLWALETNAGPTGAIAQLLEGVAALSGSALRGELTRRGLQLMDHDANDELTVLAGNPFFGPAGWEAAAPPTVIGLRASNSGSEVFRACQRGICMAIRSVLHCLLQHSGTVAPHVVVTGGMSRSREWDQMLADACGTEVHVRPLDELAGRAGAIIVSDDALRSAPAGQPPVQVYQPRAATAAMHADAFERYQELYRAAQLSADSAGQVTSARAR